MSQDNAEVVIFYLVLGGLVAGLAISLLSMFRDGSDGDPVDDEDDLDSYDVTEVDRGVIR